MLAVPDYIYFGSGLLHDFFPEIIVFHEILANSEFYDNIANLAMEYSKKEEAKFKHHNKLTHGIFYVSENNFK
jgi:hypothetical protein